MSEAEAPEAAVVISFNGWFGQHLDRAKERVTGLTAARVRNMRVVNGMRADEVARAVASEFPEVTDGWLTGMNPHLVGRALIWVSSDVMDTANEEFE